MPKSKQRMWWRIFTIRLHIIYALIIVRSLCRGQIQVVWCKAHCIKALSVHYNICAGESFDQKPHHCMMVYQYLTGSEAYTSKQCGMCGALNDNLGASELFKCSAACGFRADRDVHAARKICLRYLQWKSDLSVSLSRRKNTGSSMVVVNDDLVVCNKRSN